MLCVSIGVDSRFDIHSYEISGSKNGQVACVSKQKKHFSKCEEHDIAVLIMRANLSQSMFIASLLWGTIWVC